MSELASSASSAEDSDLASSSSSSSASSNGELSEMKCNDEDSSTTQEQESREEAATENHRWSSPHNHEEKEEGNEELTAATTRKIMVKSAITLLHAREAFGCNPYVKQYFYGSRLDLRTNPKELCSTVAWGRRRLQNMILAVGSGTPATVITNNSSSDEDQDDNSDDLMEDEIDDDNDSEDDDEGVDPRHPFHRVRRTEMSVTAEDYDNNSDHDSNSHDGNQNSNSEDAPMQEREAENGNNSDNDSNEDVPIQQREARNDNNNDNDSNENDDFDHSFERLTHNRLSDAFQREALRLLRRRLRSREDHDDNHDDNRGAEEGGDESDGDDDASVAEIQAETLVHVIQRRLRHGFDGDSDGDEDAEDSNDDNDNFMLGRRRWINNPSRNTLHTNRNATIHQNVRPSLRHGGCINTACWLDKDWGLSTAATLTSSSSSASIKTSNNRECPTQIVTSGDDRLVKFWSVAGAMGNDSPLPGGWNTFCPFADTGDSNAGTPDMPKVVEKWKSSTSKKQRLQGSVLSLATFSTGHRGNVFHVTPCHEAGNLLTCGADGYLRLIDIVSERSTVVVHPYVLEGDDDDMDLPFVFHSGMAYSHHLLTPKTGLLCSERGLHHFDLRLSPREQARSSLMQNESSEEYRRSFSCKACAIWSPHYSPSITSLQSELGSNYVFAGGSSADVCLYDLRMDGSRKRIVERYRPKGLDAGSGSGVSVSGLDVSRDGKELLVSYESDQIYSFPICHHSKAFYPTIEDIETSCNVFNKDTDSALPELASYGGHLNRFTFLKNARYAGPNDEYICTGSDSGHAWIYDRSTGTVASLLGADSSTCNGVIPHPILPYFITYGIDSTAKLWRATPVVDPFADDSATGRVNCSRRRPYEMSPVTRTWEGVQTLLKHIDDEPAALPDYVASSEEIASSGRFSSPCRRGIVSGKDSPRVGNAILALPSILRQNRYECYRAFHEELDVPVSHPLVDFTSRLSQTRLRYQADRLGLQWDPWTPWALKPSTGSTDIHPADLVPDWPSDWINFDPQMRKKNLLLPRDQFNPSGTYGKCLIESHFPGFFDYYEERTWKHPWLESRVQSRSPEGTSDNDSTSSSLCPETASEYLYQTALLLKEGGNQAMKQNLFDVAARRYDQSIQYCAVALMRYFDGEQSLKHLTQGHHELVSEGTRKSTSVIVTWSPLLQILITSRLNMALLFLKRTFLQADRAAGQARAALKLLAPFTYKEGKVISIRDKKEYILKENEPVQTYAEAQALQAKAYYRLGSAELECGDYSAAIRNFESSLKCAPGGHTSKPDSLTIKRLQEAKRKFKMKKKRDRAKFQRMHCETDEEENTPKEVGRSK